MQFYYAPPRVMKSWGVAPVEAIETKVKPLKTLTKRRQKVAEEEEHLTEEEKAIQLLKNRLKELIKQMPQEIKGMDKCALHCAVQVDYKQLQANW